LGYRYFAVEALGESTEDNVVGDVIKSSPGAYYNETVFANVLLAASEYGFRIISYDSFILDSLEQRDATSADNLVKKIFAADPQAKVLIHAGFGHIEEASGRLAFQLKERTGFDPLTVNQTRFVESSAGRPESPTYVWAIDNHIGPRPFLLTDKDGDFWSDAKDKYDIAVFWPRTEYDDGRPNWASLGRKLRKIEDSWCRNVFPCQVEVYKKYAEGVVPSDRIAVLASSDVKSVFINADDTVIVVKSQDGTIVQEIQL
jgi:hypothetical protein